jgi:hypothetical protein
MFTQETVSSILSQAKQVDARLEKTIPQYKTARETAQNVYGFSNQQVMNIYVMVDEQWQKTGAVYVQKGMKMVKDAQSCVESRADRMITRVEDALEIEKSPKDKAVVRNPKDRIVAIFVRLNYLMVVSTNNLKGYSMDLVHQGQEMVLNYSLPIYITLKATVIVTKEMIFELLENRIQDMKVTYESSKDTVTMLIAGKFNEEQIKAKIADSIQTFKEMKVKVVQKGLEIKVDGKSLRENYDIFAIKFLDVMKSMKEKGTENIVSAKQRSINLYNEVINRIKQKEIEIKTEYYQKKDVQQTEKAC